MNDTMLVGRSIDNIVDLENTDDQLEQSRSFRSFKRKNKIDSTAEPSLKAVSIPLNVNGTEMTNLKSTP